MTAFIAALARALGYAARQGRVILVLGLVAGILLPGLAETMKAWLAEMVAALLFLAALRVGPRQAVGALGDLGGSVGLCMIFQVAMPVVAIVSFSLLGWYGPLATGLILMAAASPISGGPNLAILTGNDPAPALRQLVLGTALLPLTVIPVFWLVPTLGSPVEILGSAARLLLIIFASAAVAFLLRATVFRDPAPASIEALDGLSAILMAVLVVGLMSAVGPAISGNPAAFALNMAAAFAANFGLQIAAFLILKRRDPEDAVPLAIVAGNRNIALFLTALPTAITNPLLLFIGCYQVPMFLTPIMLNRLYRRR
ncbi:MAG: hypothetical protein L0I29_06095 [Hyphomicrobiales bacterium]|nr:hypothetical protein [Hyphomicrobiales bacterium]